MTYAFTLDVPIDAATYASVREEIGAERPAGLLAHIVTPSDGGLRYLDVWESRAAWEQFRDARVTPAVRKVMNGAAPAGPPPAAQDLEIVDCWIGSTD